MAEVLGAGTGLGLKIVMGGTPMAHVSNSLRVVIPLVCPDFTSCPTDRDVIRVFATPRLAEQLKALAGG
jgi:hypothetical protein